MEYSKTFCPYPWIHVMTQPTGTVSWCCVARDNFKNDDGSMYFKEAVRKGSKLIIINNSEAYDKNIISLFSQK